jgi:hypothetical protein
MRNALELWILDKIDSAMLWLIYLGSAKVQGS